MKRLKRVALTVLALCLLVMMLPAVVSAQSTLPEDASSVIAAKKAQAEAAMATQQDLPREIVNIPQKAMRTVTSATSANYSKLRNYINSYGTTDSDGYKRLTQVEYGEGYYFYLSLINVSSGITFQVVVLGEASTRVDILLEFTLKSTSDHISIQGAAVLYEYGTAVDGVEQTISIDRSTYKLGDELPFTGNGYYLTTQEFSQLMDNMMFTLCGYWDAYIYEYLAIDLAALGFTSFCSHSTTEIRGQTPVGCVTNGYTGDEYCLSCGELISTGEWIYCVGYHSYTSACDESCNVCGEIRETSTSHTYTSDCDASCNSCNAIRTTSTKHSFDGGAFCQLCNATFGDVSTGNWQFGPVLYAYENDLMAGKGADDLGNIKFDPNSPITREEFVQVLYNAEGKPAYENDKVFPDVKDAWYKNAVLWANSMNIANGMGDGNFGVGKNITRQDLALMLYKYASLKGVDLTAEEGRIDQFADGDKVSGYAQTAMNWAVKNGVLSGKGEAGKPLSTFRLDPTGTATRAECAAMLKNFMTAFGL